MDLTKLKCEPCEKGTKPFDKKETDKYLSIVQDWNEIEGKKIKKEFKFKDFKEALKFVNEVGNIAEQENHHPNILLYGWNKVRITLTTHAIGGLSINDFVLAAKIDTL
jgi:4a-hydroxytetrahydrobiopterin dehydratase